ncbi:putative nucleoside-diphosphate-sugar epimerase [Bisporella sp. PMI_857]|nr:putative nucleoside-diphosphate-sugar epimerase [Bisporella sp. PMI_857]
MPELIALTCASGKQCSQIIPRLYPQSSLYKLRLVVKSPSSLARLQEKYPDAEVIRANLNDPHDCEKIVDGASVVYYVSPGFEPHEARYGINVVAAAVEESKKPGSKFSHFIFSSVLHTHLRKMLNHDRKREIEEYLCESPLAWTVLQPSHFMDNTIARILQLKYSPEPDPVFMATQNPEIAFSFSCVYDFAEASVKVIEERSKHFYATYQIVSTWPTKYVDYIQTIGTVIGKNIKIKQAPYEQVIEIYAKNIFGDSNVELGLKEGPARMLLYYNGRGLPGNPRVTEWLLNRPPTSPVDLAKILLAASAK